jgi:hypothetical protein
MMTEYVPVLADDPAVNLTWLVEVVDAPTVRLAGEKEAVTPVGNVPALRITAELKPFTAETESVVLVSAPILAVRDVVDEVSENEGTGTVNVSVRLLVSPPKEWLR